LWLGRTAGTGLGIIVNCYVTIVYDANCHIGRDLGPKICFPEKLPDNAHPAGRPTRSACDGRGRIVTRLSLIPPNDIFLSFAAYTKIEHVLQTKGLIFENRRQGVLVTFLFGDDW
jgi:hypothetical protein